MHRENDIIFFDPEDHESFDKLPNWAPIEAIPGIYEGIIERQHVAILELEIAQGGDVFDLSEAKRQAQMEAANKKTCDLETLRSRLGKLAAAELAASGDIDGSLSGIEGLELGRLHEK